MSIGVLIITKNEQANLEECLRTCAFFDEIVVVDSQSTDDTIAIAKKYTSHTYINPFKNFRDQRMVGVSHMKSDWVFFLDADERIPEALQKKIKEFATQDFYTMLEIPRRNYMLGEWVAHSGWYPDFQRRLVKKSTLSFQDQIVHERIESSGPMFRDDSVHLIHHTCQSLSAYFLKINQCTSLEAEQYVDSDVFKITRWGIFTRSLGMFTQTLFHHKGLKDGMRGFIVAGINFIYSFMLMVKLWEKRLRR